MKIGEHVKIHIPGESPWATVVATHEDGRMAVRIDNHPACGDMHGYKLGDVVTVEEKEYSDFKSWELAPLDRQLPTLAS